MTSNVQIEPVEVAAFSHGEDQLKITWSDGHMSKFDALWLRDNCPGDRDSRTGQRLIDIVDVPPEPKLLSVHRMDDVSLAISWSGEQHTTHFSLAWLRRHCYCDQHIRSSTPARILWRGFIPGIRGLRYSDVLGNIDARGDSLTSLIRYGLTLLSEVPCEDGYVLSVAALFGYVTETNYGRIFDVKSVPVPNNLAYTDAGLGLHTDNPYRDPVPGFQFLHCLQSSDVGGESLFADGFAITTDLRVRDPEAFAILSTIPVGFSFRDAQSDLTCQRPLIAVDDTQELAAIHYNNRSMLPLSIRHGQMRTYYRAYRVFGQMLRDPQYILRLTLQPGDLVVFHNHRILHGRTSFRDLAVSRHLQGCYVSPDGVFSNFALLQKSGKEMIT
jgi:gamma-butyrobetaine hydroxylase